MPTGLNRKPVGMVSMPYNAPRRNTVKGRRRQMRLPSSVMEMRTISSSGFLPGVPGRVTAGSLESK